MAKWIKFARHLELPNHSTHSMKICGRKNRKNRQQKFIFELGTLNLNAINERFFLN